MQVDCFPDAPSEWPRQVFHELAAVNPPYKLDKAKEYPFVEMASVAEDFGGIVRFDFRKAEASGLARFRSNDILFGKITPCAENGKVALVEELPADYALGSTEFIVLSPRPGSNPRFVYALACSTPIRGRAISRMEGSTGRLRVTEDTFTKWLLVPVPSPKEQNAIARILDAVDTAMERTRTAIEKAQGLKRGLAQTLFSRGIGHTEFRQTEIGLLPIQWNVLPLDEAITEAQYGLSMPMNARGQYPILRMAAIQDGDIRLDDLKFVDLPEDIAHQYLLRRGDVLFNRTNSADLVGKVGVYRSDMPAVFASYLIRLKIKPEVADNYFLGQQLAAYSAQSRVKRYATPGVQQVNINATNLRRVLVALPPGESGLQEQRQIAEILERQDDSIRALGDRLQMLDRLKRGLMQDLLTGKVRLERAAAGGSAGQLPLFTMES